MRNAVRTGWRTEHRRCPLHGSPLELWLDDTDFTRWTQALLWNHDDNRIGWYCEACLGAWLENRFAETPVSVPTERFIVSCPACKSRRVTHECVTGCCESHSCRDCKAAFDVRARLLEPGPAGVEPAARVRREADLVVSGSFEVVERSGITRPYRRCEKDESALELVFFASAPGRPIVGWACGACARVASEASFRRWRQHWVADVDAAVACPVCQSDDVLPVSNGHACASCGARVAIEVGEWKRQKGA